MPQGIPVKVVTKTPTDNNPSEAKITPDSSFGFKRMPLYYSMQARLQIVKSYQNVTIQHPYYTWKAAIVTSTRPIDENHQFIHEPNVIELIPRHLGLPVPHSREPQAHGPGPVIREDFDEGWPRYEERAIVYH